jgi:hypothetical protein
MDKPKPKIFKTYNIEESVAAYAADNLIASSECDFIIKKVDTYIKSNATQSYELCAKENLKNFTGIDSPYEAPENPEIEINTAEMSVEDAAERVINGLIERGIIEV